MGCDIHPVVERRDPGGPWQVVPLSEEADRLEDRNYRLFAVLANVRNGFGFGGVETGDVIVPISKPRGLPKDFEQGKHDDEAADGKWLGDHSHTWVTLAELHAYPWAIPMRRRGIVTLEVFRGWDRVSRPREYSLASMGQGVVTLSIEDVAAGRIPADATRVWVEVGWIETVGQACAGFVEHVLPWLRTLGAPEDVRIVMGFDS